MSQKNYDIIVIGAGCGGLTAAACAAKEGKKVLLLERCNTPGGFLGSFVRGRFEFDISLNQLFGFSNTEGFGDAEQILDYLGIKNKIDYCKISEAYRFITKTKDGSKIDITMPTGINNFINVMESYVSGSKVPLEKLFSVAEEINESGKYFSDIDGKLGLSDVHNIMKKYGNFIRTAPYSVNEVLNALGLPEKAQQIFNAFWMNFGVDCDRLSFTHYISVLYSFIKYGGFIPSKRSYALAMALESNFTDNGGEIRYNSHVSRIVLKNKNPSGVILKSGERINASHIICNCSPTTVFGKMIKGQDIPKTALKRTNARTFGARGACVYLGLNKAPEELGIKNYSVIITDSVDTTEQFNLMKKIDTNNALTAVCLNIVNKDASPKGTAILCLKTIYTDNCWADISPESYFNEKDMLAARLISSYERATGINIHKYIEEIEVATPVTFAGYTATPQGVIYGYAGDDWDSLVPRIMTEADDCDIENLHFCGGWGTQLSGVSSSISSGRNAAFTAINYINEERGGENE